MVIDADLKALPRKAHALHAAAFEYSRKRRRPMFAKRQEIVRLTAWTWTGCMT